MKHDDAEDKFVLDSLVLKKTTRLYNAGSLKQDFHVSVLIFSSRNIQSTQPVRAKQKHTKNNRNPGLKNQLTAWNALKRIWLDQKHKTNLLHMGYSVLCSFWVQSKNVSSKTFYKLQIHEYFSRCDIHKFHFHRRFMRKLTIPYNCTHCLTSTLPLYSMRTTVPRASCLFSGTNSSESAATVSDWSGKW